jgi:ferric-dicitrate binding protein FerR (iron transport regulator)
MTHPSHDTLWAWALAREDAAEPVATHLASCPACVTVVADIRVAQQALASLPPVPPLPEALAERVGAALAEKADRRFLSRWGRWWEALWTPRWAWPVAVTALLLALVVRVAQTDATPTPDARPVAVAPVQKAPTPAPTLPAAATKVSSRVTARVSMARKARAQGEPVAKAQRLEQGATVATERGGSLWMRLPDGTRAGLTGASQVTLAGLDTSALRLEVAHGNLAMVVPHRAERMVTVQAGEVEVKDLGTRFLVSRTEGRVLVAVEEGAVEVKTPTTTRTVAAGRAVSWHDGRLESLAWEVPTTPTTPAVPPPASAAAAFEPAAAPPASVARLDQEVDEDDAASEATDSEPAPSVAETTATPSATTSEEEWAQLPANPTTTPGPSTTRGPSTPTDGGAGTTAPDRPRPVRFDLGGLEARVQRLQRALLAPFTPDERDRASRMVEVTVQADRGDCRRALVFAERWLRQPSTRRAEEPSWRRTVLTQKWRCLMKQGRVDQAQRVQRELDAQP